MPRKSEIYENLTSKRGVKIQIRPYDSNGNYENLEGNNATLQIKNASPEGVMAVIRKAIVANFGNKN